MGLWGVRRGWKMAPIFLEAPNLWVRCRRRFFFFRKMAPHVLGGFLLELFAIAESETLELQLGAEVSIDGCRVRTILK